jgi:hypothetical protein
VAWRKARKETKMRIKQNWAVLTAASIAIGAYAGGCTRENESENEELPEVSQIETNKETGARELTEELVLGPEDEGQTILATGWVEGRPLDNGFFLRTEYNRVVFIEGKEDVSTGDEVSVTGVVRKSDAEMFNGWEEQALGENLEPDLDLWRGVYMEASEVHAVEGVAGDKVDPAKRDRRY